MCRRRLHVICLLRCQGLLLLFLLLALAPRHGLPTASVGLRCSSLLSPQHGPQCCCGLCQRHRWSGSGRPRCCSAGRPLGRSAVCMAVLHGPPLWLLAAVLRLRLAVGILKPGGIHSVALSSAAPWRCTSVTVLLQAMTFLVLHRPGWLLCYGRPLSRRRISRRGSNPAASRCGPAGLHFGSIIFPLALVRPAFTRHQTTGQTCQRS